MSRKYFYIFALKNLDYNFFIFRHIEMFNNKIKKMMKSNIFGMLTLVAFLTLGTLSFANAKVAQKQAAKAKDVSAEQFKAMDKDNNNCLSLAEFTGTENADVAAKKFKEADKDNNNCLSLEEYKAATTATTAAAATTTATVATTTTATAKATTTK